MVRFTRKKGGRYIGQGTYGCTFYDKPLKCKAENSRNSGEVLTKLIDRKYGAEEYIQNHIWAEIDPNEDFSLYSYKYCKVDADNIKSEDELNKCTSTFSDPIKNRRLLFYKYGGTDLYKLKPNAKNYLGLFKSFQNLIKGLSIAHKNDVVHLDIKEPNIVVDKDNHLRFIDFGLSLISDEINLSQRDEYHDMMTYTQLYPYWPFELQYMLDNRLAYGKVFANDINTFYQNNVIDPYDYTQSTYYNNKWEKKSLDVFYNIVKNYNYKDLSNVLKNVDVYSLGVVLIKLVKRYFYHVLALNSENKNEIKVIISGKKDRIFLSSLTKENFPNEKIFDYQKELAEYVTKPLLEVAQQMVLLDPTKRINAAKAAEEYEKIIPNLEKHLTLKKVYNGLKDLKILNIESTDFIPNTKTPSLENLPKQTSPSRKKSVKKINSKKITFEPFKARKISFPPENNTTTRKEKLDKIYEKSMKYPLELNRIVKIARALGSTLPEKTTTREEFRDDIIRLAKGTKRNFDLI